MPTVLFACRHNAGRSQIAAAFAKKLSEGRVRIITGGTDPADRIHPNVAKVMAEVGIDLSAESPKLLEDSDVEEADVVVTMGCGEQCPFFPGKRYLEWEVPDPSRASLEETRKIRDEIENRVRTLLDELGH